MFENLDVFKMSAAMARHAGQRQAVIAQNVANADTPDFVARDISPFADTFRNPDSSHQPRATRARHLHGLFAGQPDAPMMKTPGDGAPNGNQVSLETELLKSVESKRQHDRAVAIYKSALQVLRATIK